MRLYLPKQERDELYRALHVLQSLNDLENTGAKDKQENDNLSAAIAGTLYSPLLPTGLFHNVLMFACFAVGTLAFLTTYRWLFCFYLIAMAFSPWIRGGVYFRTGQAVRRVHDVFGIDQNARPRGTTPLHVAALSEPRPTSVPCWPPVWIQTHGMRMASRPCT